MYADNGSIGEHTRPATHLVDRFAKALGTQWVKITLGGGRLMYADNGSIGEHTRPATHLVEVGSQKLWGLSG